MRKSLVEIQGVSKHFDGVAVLRDLTFSIESDVAYALLGPNGAGKTTLLNIIAGYLRPDRGRVTFRGHNVSNRSPARLARAGIARTFQSVKLFGTLSVKDNLLIALRDKPDENLWTAAFGKHADSIFRWNERVEQLLEEFYLTKVRGHRASELSFGQQKLLSLAMALANPSRLLLLDEPVGSLQSEIAEQISEKLRALKQTMLIVEHNLDFVREFASEILFLSGGKIIARGEFDDVMANPRVRESYL